MSFVYPQSHIFNTVNDNASILLDSMMTVTCDDIITLSANILGDSTGHTFLWEQIDGIPVTWLEAQNQQSVMFQQPSDRSDKVFRFTLDKGLDFEKSKEIIVSAIPTEIIKTNNIGIINTNHGFIPEYIYDVYAMIPGERYTEGQTWNDVNRSLLFSPKLHIGYEISLVDNSTGSSVDTMYIDYKKNTGANIDYMFLNNAITDKSYTVTVSDGKVTESLPAVSFTTKNYPSKMELLIVDEIIRSTVKYPFIELEVLEVRNVTIQNMSTEDIIEYSDGVRKSNELQEHSVLEVMTRTLSTKNDDEELFSTSLEIGRDSICNYSVTEVKEFQFSSLG
jgi:hypothetical protein